MSTTPALPGTPEDRRRHRRFRIERDGKVYRPESRQYTPARTRDLSVSGALLEVSTQRPFAPGERVEVAVASSADGVVRNDAMVEGVVIRADLLDDHRQAIAVRYLTAERAHRAA